MIEGGEKGAKLQRRRRENRGKRKESSERKLGLSVCGAGMETSGLNGGGESGLAVG